MFNMYAFSEVIVFRDDKGETNIDYGALGNFSIAGCWVHLSRDSSSYIASFYFPTGSKCQIGPFAITFPSFARFDFFDVLPGPF